MKITDYAKVTDLGSDTTFLVDGSNGTKGVTAPNVAKNMFKLGDLSKNDTISSLVLDPNTDFVPVNRSYGIVKLSMNWFFWNLLDAVANKQTRRMFFRGVKLGDKPSSFHLSNIANGSFRGMFIGDYWEWSGTIWRIADFDYWMSKGPQGDAISQHHLVILTDDAIVTDKINPTATTNGGFAGSWIMGAGYDDAFDILDGGILPTFAGGSSHLLTLKELMSYGATNGCVNNNSWKTDMKWTVPNEPMIFGSYLGAMQSYGTTKSDLRTIDNTQLALLQLWPTGVCPCRNAYWLRDLYNSGSFCGVSAKGYNDYFSASEEIGYRIVFALC